MILIIIILAFLVEFTFNLRFISKTVCLFVILMETVSIFENLKKAGLNLGKLGNILKVKFEETGIENINYKKTIEIINKIAEENKTERSKEDE